MWQCKFNFYKKKKLVLENKNDFMNKCLKKLKPFIF